MLRVRYTAWDGTQQVRLSADKVFERLSEYLSFTDDVQQALDWLLHQGLEWEGMRVMGLDDFLEQLREEMRSDAPRGEPRRSVRPSCASGSRSCSTLEREALEQARPTRRTAQRRRELLEQPAAAPLRGARAPARRAGLEDADARAALEELLEELDEHPRPRGLQAPLRRPLPRPASLNYAEAVELMRTMERLKRLEEQLLSGNLDAVDAESLRELLGDEALRNFQRAEGGHAVS